MSHNIDFRARSTENVREFYHTHRDLTRFVYKINYHRPNTLTFAIQDN